MTGTSDTLLGAPAPAPAPAADAPAADAPAADAPAPAADAPAPAADAPAPAADAPESYTFTAPEGTGYNPELIEAFSGVAKELNLPQESAQKILDTFNETLGAAESAMQEESRAAWEGAARGDKEFGGDKFDENLSTAKKALDAFASDDLKALLNESGLGSHPEVIRLLYRAGKAIGEDTLVGGQGGGDNSPDPRRLYSASQMNP